MREPRKPIRTAFTVVSALGVVAVLHEFGVKYAEQRGWYDDLPDRVEAALNWLVSLSEPLWFKIGLAFVVGATAGLWLDAALRRRAGGSTPPPPAPPRVYVGRVQVRLKLVSDSAIGFYFIGLNNSAAPMAIKGVRGWVDYRDHSRGPASVLVRLSGPLLSDSQPKEFAPGAEFTAVVFHELPRADADALQGLLVRDGAEVAFAFRDLHVEIGWNGGGAGRLPIPDEITCETNTPVLLGLPMPADRRQHQRWPPTLLALPAAGSPNAAPPMPPVARGEASGGDAAGVREGQAVLDSPAMYSSGERRFMLRFGKRDAQSVYFYKDGTNLDWIASIRGVQSGSTVDTTKLHPKTDSRELVVSELFLARNAAGYVMQGRLKDIRTREIDGHGEDMAIFDYKIVPGQPSISVAV